MHDPTVTRNSLEPRSSIGIFVDWDRSERKQEFVLDIESNCT